MLKWYMSKIYVHRIFPRKICPSDLCSWNMPGLSCTRNMSEIKVLVAHADSLMCRALCPPPMAMEYVHTIYERRMATCGGYVPCTFLMSMVLVDMATRVYSTSTVKSTQPKDIKLTDTSRGCYPWASTVGGDFPDMTSFYWRVILVGVDNV